VCWPSRSELDGHTRVTSCWRGAASARAGIAPGLRSRHRRCRASTATAQSPPSAPTPVWPIVITGRRQPGAAAPTAAPPARPRPPARSPMTRCLGAAPVVGVTAPPPAALTAQIRVPETCAASGPHTHDASEDAAPAPVRRFRIRAHAPDGATVPHQPPHTDLRCRALGHRRFRCPGPRAALDDYFDRLDAPLPRCTRQGRAIRPMPAGEAR